MVSCLAGADREAVERVCKRISRILEDAEGRCLLTLEAGALDAGFDAGFEAGFFEDAGFEAGLASGAATSTFGSDLALRAVVAFGAEAG